MQQRWEVLEQKVDEVHKSVSTIRRYIAIAFWVGVVMLVFPFVGLLFAIPTFLSTFSVYSGL